MMNTLVAVRGIPAARISFAMRVGVLAAFAVLISVLPRAFGVLVAFWALWLLCYTGRKRRHKSVPGGSSVPSLRGRSFYKQTAGVAGPKNSYF